MNNITIGRKDRTHLEVIKTGDHLCACVMSAKGVLQGKAWIGVDREGYIIHRTEAWSTEPLKTGVKANVRSLLTVARFKQIMGAAA